MGFMTYILSKPVIAATALGLSAAMLADALDGTMDYDFDGAPKVIATLATAPSSSPVFLASSVWFEDTILGGGHEVIPPGEDRSGDSAFVSKST